MREFYEETGLELEESMIDTSTTYTEHYEFFHPKKQDTILKTVTYYTAQLPYTDVSALSGYSEGDGEILDKKIVSLTDAIDLATYDATRDVLQQVSDSMDHKINK